MLDNRREMPIDQGWSWVICFASFLCMFIMGTTMQTISVLFLELVVEFGSSVTLTSLTVMCYILALSVSSVISTTVFVPKFGERPVVVVAGFLVALGSVGFFLAPNIVVFIVFSAGKGTCMGLIFVPTVSLLSRYFNKRRSLATTICNSGICVSSIVSPPVIRAVTAEYGMRGTFLILCAVELHLMAAGLLMRPVSSYRAASTENEDPKTGADPDSSLTKDTSQIIKDMQSEPGPNVDKVSYAVPTSLPDANDLNGLTQYDRNFNNFSHSSYIRDNGNPAVSDTELRNDDKPDHLEIERLLSEEKSNSHQFSRKTSVPRRDSTSQHSARGSGWSISHTAVDNVAHHQSMLSVTSDVEPALSAVGFQGSAPAEAEEQGWKSCCCIAIIRQIFDPQLFSQWSFRVFLISCVPSAATQFLMQYIPTIAVIKGATKDQAATLVTIIGSVDLGSRLCVGVFADTHLLKHTQIVAIAQVCLGILCQFNPLFDSFEKMIAMVVLMGLFVGTRQSMMAMTLIEIVGMVKMARCLSISAMVSTISAASHSPMLSAIMEATGSYNIPLHYVGAALVVGSALLLLASFLERGDTKSGSK
ncbi:hypothetical protein BsWGS_27989 [Bradybaena similaris]